MLYVDMSIRPQIIAILLVLISTDLRTHDVPLQVSLAQVGHLGPLRRGHLCGEVLVILNEQLGIIAAHLLLLYHFVDIQTFCALQETLVAAVSSASRSCGTSGPS